MKKLLTFIISLTISLSSLFAQEEEITNTFNAYVEATKSPKLEAQLDYFYPALFDYIPKEEYLAALEMAYSNPKIQMDNEKILSISEVYTEEEIKYALLDISLELNLDVSELKGVENGELTVEQMKEDFIMDHGEENVSFNQETYVFEVNISNQAYVINDPAVGAWKLLPKDEEMMDLIEDLIPEWIRSKLEH